MFPSWSGAASPETAAAAFRVSDGGAAVKLSKANTVLGRKSDLCTVTLDHHTISRRHAVVLHKADGTLHLMDLASAQGTRVDGRPLEPNVPVQLQDGAQVRFGQSPVTYVLDLPTAAVADAGLRSQLPPVFGGGATFKDPKKGGQEPPADEGRRKRGAEIAAMTASLLGPPMVAARPADAPGPTASEGGPGRLAAFEEVAGSADDEAELGLEERARGMGLPVSHEVTLPGHEKPVLALAMDPAGGRILSGSLDSKVKFWDFGGMDRSHRSFRETEAQTGYGVVGLSFSPSGDRFVGATTSVQPAVFNREGGELLRFVRGDMYLADASHTKGHTHPVTGAVWHPAEKDLVVTSASDGTLRTWDLNGTTALEGRLCCQKIYKIKSQRGVRIHATSVAVDPDGDRLAGGGADGSVQLFSLTRGGAANRPDAVLRDAHASGDVTCVSFSPSGRLLLSRGSDDAVKVWDVRKTSSPLRTFGGLESFFSTSNAVFSPDGRFVCAGTSVKKGGGVGRLKFFQVEGRAHVATPVLDLGVSPGSSVVQVLWHPALQQILCSTAAGPLKLLYDPLLSKHGALLSAARTPRQRDASDFVASSDPSSAVGEIINPHALPMFRDDKFKKRRRDEPRPGELRKPNMPANGPAAQTTSQPLARKNFTEMFLEGRMKTSNLKDQDSRQELLKYATATDGRQYTGAAYAHNPQALHTKTLEQEKEELEAKEKRRLNGMP